MIRKGFSILAVSILYLISLLPFAILYLLADVLFALLFYITRYRRKVVQENLANAFPEKPYDERKLIEKKYYRYLADLIVESIKMFSISESAIKKRFTLTNFDTVVQPLFNSNRSIIGAVGHYGNWEMGALRLSTMTEKHRVVIYKPLSNPVFDHAFKKMRERFGAILVSMKSAARKLVELRRECSFTVIVSDQTPARPEVNYFTQFLNQPTAMFLGIEKLAKITDSAIVFCDVRRVKRGYYNCNFVLLFDKAKSTADYEITRAHVAYLERVIRHEPQYWLWSHRRWKFKPEDMIK